MSFALGFDLGFNSQRQFMQMLKLADFSVSRASSRTVWGYPADGVIADGMSLLTVPDNIVAFTGGRLLAGNVWSAVDADGAALTPAVSVADAGTNYILNSTNLATGTSPVGGAVTQTSSTELAPDGSSTAFRYDFTASPAGGIAKSGQSATHEGRALWYRAGSGSGDCVLISHNGDTVLGTVTPTTTWQRLILDAVPSGFPTNFYLFDSRGAEWTFDGLLEIWNPQVEALHAGPDIRTTGSTVTRAADVVTIPTPGVLSASSGAIEFTVTPSRAGQTAKYALGSTVDASNLLAVEMNATTIDLVKKVAGTDYSAQEAYSHAKDTKIRIQIYWDSSGIGIRAAAASADITALSFHTDANALAMPLDTDLQIGNQGGVNLFVGDDLVADFKFHTGKSVAGWL